MNVELLTEKITQLLLENILEDFDSLSPDEDLLADGMVDSLGMVQLVGYLNDEFGVDVPPEDFIVEHFQTIAHIARYLEGKM